MTSGYFSTASSGSDIQPLSVVTQAYWKMDEASSITRVDSKGSNNLAVTGTVNAAAGLINQAVTLGGVGGNYLSVADNANLNVGTTGAILFFGWAWLQFSSIAANMVAVEKGTDNPAANKAWYILFNQSAPTALGFGGSDGASASAHTAGAANFPGVSYTVGPWYLFYWGYDGTRRFLGINNMDSSINSNGNGGKFIYSANPLIIKDDPSFPLVVGQAGTAGALPWNGLIDEVGFATGRVMTPSDVAVLWNNGAGRQYPYTS